MGDWVAGGRVWEAGLQDAGVWEAGLQEAGVLAAGLQEGLYSTVELQRNR